MGSDNESQSLWDQSLHLGYCRDLAEPLSIRNSLVAAVISKHGAQRSWTFILILYLLSAEHVL